MPCGHDEDKRPDFFGEKEGLPVVIAEVKKPNELPSANSRDKRKLPCLMKLALNKLLMENVENPAVIGLLFQGMVKLVYLQTSSMYSNNHCTIYCR